MMLNHQNDPFWRRTLILKTLDRWERLILESEVRLDLRLMVQKARHHDFLMWPIGRLAFAHPNGCDEVALDKDFSSKSILDSQLLLKVLRYFLTEPELTSFIKRESERSIVSSWFEENFSWKDTRGEEVRLTEFVLKFSDYCLQDFFEENQEEGYSSAQLYVFTQLRSHDRPNCTKVIPFSGISAIQKPDNFDKWPNKDGHTYPDSELIRAVKTVREHFEKEADRPSIPPMTFNLN